MSMGTTDGVTSQSTQQMQLTLSQQLLDARQRTDNTSVGMFHDHLSCNLIWGNKDPQVITLLKRKGQSDQEFLEFLQTVQDIENSVDKFGAMHARKQFFSYDINIFTYSHFLSSTEFSRICSWMLLESKLASTQACFFVRLQPANITDCRKEHNSQRWADIVNHSKHVYVLQYYGKTYVSSCADGIYWFLCVCL